MTEFDEATFLEQNKMTFVINLNQYHTLINGLFPVQNGQVLELINAMMTVGEPQKAKIVTKYEAEKAAFTEASAPAKESAAA